MFLTLSSPWSCVARTLLCACLSFALLCALRDMFSAPLSGLRFFSVHATHKLSVVVQCASHAFFLGCGFPCVPCALCGESFSQPSPLASHAPQPVRRLIQS